MLKDPKGWHLNEETWVTEGSGPMEAWGEEASDALWVFWEGQDQRQGDWNRLSSHTFTEGS